MARTAVTPTPLLVNSSAAAPAATNTGSGAGNGVTISAPSAPELLVLKVVATNAGTVSVKAGTGVAAISAGQGDLTVALTSAQEAMIGPFESARFQQADGSLAVDFSAVMAVQAYRVNRH